MNAVLQSKVFPPTLLLPTQELLQRFYLEIGGVHALPKEDVKEVLAQIIEVMLNNDEYSDYQLDNLPNEDRLIYGNRIERARLKQAVQNLGTGIRRQLVQLDAYTEQGFPYFLDRMVGLDIQLSYLPY